MRRKISLLLVVLVSVFSCRLLAQDPVLPAIIPSSPESGSLCRAGLLSNNLYTGTASFSIPLYEVALKSLRLPIGLQYSSNGVRNSDLPGSVGMNFNLLAGGRIMRIIHDESDGAPENTPYIGSFPNPYNHDANLLYYLNYAADYYWDTEPDEYIYNFNGMSGRFFVDSSGIGRCIPENNLKIEVSGADDDYKSFSITTAEGTVYTFNGVSELTNSFQLYGAHSYSTSYRNETAWFLTNITTQTAESISFQYMPASVTVAPGTHSVSYSSSNSNGCYSNGNYCPTENYSEPNFLQHDTWYISAITASSGVEVDFTYENRPDYSLSGDKRLTNIVVSESLNGSDRTLKKYTLKYSNYRCYDSWSTNSCWFFLDTLVNESIDGSGVAEKHSFEYYGKSYLWNRTYPYDWDVMGYFHGGGYYPIDWTHIDTAATRLYYQTLGVVPNHWKYPDPTQMPAGMLTQVNLPTGGYQKFYYEPHITAGGVIAGGVRVKQIDNYDPLSGTTSKKFYKYTSLADTTVSSGKNSYYPFYASSYNYGFVCGTTIQDCPSTIVSDNSLTPFSLSKGSNITYSTVIESDDANLVNGGVEHHFYNWPGSPYGNSWPELGDFFTLPPSNTEPDLNGTETKTVFFKKNATGWLTLKKVENSFTADYRNQKTRPGYITRRRYQWPYGYNPPQYFEFEGFDLIPYKYKSFKYNLTKTVTTAYDQKGQNPVVDSIKYEYADIVGGQPTKIIYRASDTAQVVTYNWYANQLSNGSNIYATMLGKHMVSIPVESKTYRNGNLISAQKTVFNNNFGGGIVLPEQVQTRQMPDTSSYKTRTRFYVYGTGGAVQEMAKENDVRQCYIYGYPSGSITDNFPIAEVTNASIGQVAYTSFEGNGKGGWTYSGTPQTNPASVTGDKCYDLSGGNITKAISSGTTYIVTFWLKNNTGTASVNSGSVTSVITKNDWTLYTKTITGASTITLSGTGKIDELRLYPQGAIMRTMTYQPFIGISRECDVNNRVISYQYDGLGRLLLVRDEDKKIIKKHCYSYKGQTENCNLYGNTVHSGNFARNNCSAGYGPPGMDTYTVPANTYYATTQELANEKAQQDVTDNGQDYVNAFGSTCVPGWYNVQKSGNFTRNNCSSGYSGSTVTYTVPAGSYFSTTSQTAADALAQNDVNTNGQAYANNNGTCTQTMAYMQITVNASTSVVVTQIYHNGSGQLFSYINQGNSYAKLVNMGSNITLQVNATKSTLFLRTVTVVTGTQTLQQTLSIGSGNKTVTFNGVNIGSSGVTITVSN